MGKIASTVLLELVLEAMRAHARVQDVQRNACGVLRNLVRIEATQAKVESLGGVHLLHAAIRNHHQAVDLRWHCCGAWQDLTKNLVGQLPEYKEGGPPDLHYLCSDNPHHGVTAVTEVEL